MTLVVDRDVTGPTIHVLAIGVGKYRHLPGGATPVPHDTLGLSQLTGPALSAVAFVEWVRDHMRHPSARVGTVELLTSGAADSAYPEVDIPSASHVKDAFNRWYQRCDASPENIAILYFCGHGVERESQFLLLEDFAESELTLLENTMDIGDLYEAMSRCKARSQYFFVDACREIPFDLHDLLNGNARNLLTRKLIGDQRRDAALMFATSGGAQAYGRSDEVTRFTKELIRALNGLGGRPYGDGWAVDISSLYNAVTRLMAADTEAPFQQPTMRGTGATPLHLCHEPPVVPVAVACRPTAAIDAATAVLTRSRPLAGSLQQPCASAIGWSFDVPADQYLLSVTFPRGGFIPCEQVLIAWPPGLDTELVVAVQ